MQSLSNIKDLFTATGSRHTAGCRRSIQSDTSENCSKDKGNPPGLIGTIRFLDIKLEILLIWCHFKFLILILDIPVLSA